MDARFLGRWQRGFCRVYKKGNRPPEHRNAYGRDGNGGPLQSSGAGMEVVAGVATELWPKVAWTSWLRRVWRRRAQLCGPPPVELLSAS
jgi:hypothetical protein